MNNSVASYRVWLGCAVLLVMIGPICSVVRAQGKFSIVKTVHFDVRYQRGIVEEDAQKVADFLQQDYQYLSTKLGIDLKRSLEVRIYDSVNKFLAEARVQKPWRGGIYQRRVLYLQPVTALVTRGIFEQTLLYELSMAVLDEASRKGCPLWLVESFAVYHSGEMANLSEPYGVRVTQFADLEQDIQEYHDPPQRSDVHYVLGRTMKFFVERYGEDKTLSMFAAFDGALSTDAIFQKVFNEKSTVIEKAWAEYIGTHSPKFPR